MSWAVLALRLGQPHQCNRARPKYTQSEPAYRRIFTEQYDLNMYLAALEFCKAVEAAMLAEAITDDPYEPRNYATMFRFLYAYLYALSVYRRIKLSDMHIMELSTIAIDPNVMQKIHAVIVRCRDSLRDKGHSPRRLHRSESFQAMVTEQCLASDG